MPFSPAKEQITRESAILFVSTFVILPSRIHGMAPFMKESNVYDAFANLQNHRFTGRGIYTNDSSEAFKIAQLLSSTVQFLSLPQAQ